MTKQEVYEFLKEKGVAHDIVEHPAVFTVEEVIEQDLPEPDTWAKNLFLRDGKKRNYVLITMSDHKRTELKKLEEMLGLKHLKFASENDLMKYMALTKGSVTPLGILDDEERRVHVYIDSYFKDHRISIHPCDNTASVYMDTGDLLDIIREHGNPVEFIDL